MDVAGRYVFAFLSGQGRGWSSHFTLKYYVRHTNEIFNLLYKNSYQKWKRNFKVIRYGVGLGMLKPMSEIQPTLLPAWYRNERLYEAMDLISEKFGLFTLHSGILTGRKIIKPEVTGYLGDKKFQLANN